MATAPDLSLVFMCVNCLTGLYVTYKSIRHYQMVKSREFLLIAMYFFSLTFFVAFRIFWNYSDNHFERVWRGGGNLFWYEAVLWIILHLIWGAGIIAIIFHILGLFEWRKRHPIVKGILLLIAVEGILEALYYNLFFIQLIYYQDFQHYVTNGYTTTAYPWTNLWLFHLIPSFEPAAAVNFYLAIQAFVLALAYITVKPVMATKEITVTRVAWICFGFITSFQWILRIPWFVNLPLFQDNSAFWESFQQLSVPAEFLESLATVVLMVVVARYPEALLITEYQVTKAVKLYKLIDKTNTSTKILELQSSEKRLVDYIQSLPADLRNYR